MPVILEQFVQSLSDSGLMTADEVQAFLDTLSPDERPGSAEDLAKLLYRQKKLTKFQAQAIYQGKTKGLVVGNYVVLDKIGSGGMGHVYKAEHKRMKRVVALKVLPSAVTKSKEAIQRFQREAEAAAKLVHPNVVTAFDADEADGVHFLVMQYVEGSDLSILVRQRGTLTVTKALDHLVQAAKGLEYAHSQGVIHRDIKPSNLLLSSEGTVKILDMGLARLEQEVGLDKSAEAAALTQIGQVMGTIDFMPPEQAMDTRNADQRADIYSLGCTLFYLLNGRAVYGGDTLAKKILAHREAPIPSLCQLRPEVPEKLDAVFQKMVAKRVDERYGSMSEVLAELEACRATVEEGLGETIAYTGQVAAEIDTGNDRHGPFAATVKPGATEDSALEHWLHEQLPEGPTHFVTKPRERVKLSRRQVIIGSVVGGVAFLAIPLLAADVHLARGPDEVTRVNLRLGRIAGRLQPASLVDVHDHPLLFRNRIELHEIRVFVVLGRAHVDRAVQPLAKREVARLVVVRLGQDVICLNPDVATLALSPEKRGACKGEHTGDRQGREVSSPQSDHSLSPEAERCRRTTSALRRGGGWPGRLLHG